MDTNINHIVAQNTNLVIRFLSILDIIKNPGKTYKINWFIIKLLYHINWLSIIDVMYNKTMTIIFDLLF